MKWLSEITVKKVWEIPSINKLKITQTFAGGSGDEDKTLSGPDDE